MDRLLPEPSLATRNPQLSLAVMEHPFRRDLRDTVLVPLAEPMSLLDLRLKHFPSDLPAIVYLNGVLAPEDRLAFTYPRAGDYVMIVAALSGGGGGAKGILRAVLMIAVAAVAMFVAPWLMGFTIFWGNTLLTGLLTGALMLAGGLVVNALLPPTTAGSTSSSDSSKDSQAYAWSPQNTEQQGIPLARWYGFHKVYGNIISSFIETLGYDQFLNAIICIGLGPVAGLGDFHINDQPAANFKDVSIQCKYGTLGQAAMSGFTDTKTEYASSVEIRFQTTYTFVTVGNDFDGIEVDLSFPYGLWKASETSSTLQEMAVDMAIQVRKFGDPTWIDVTKGAEQETYSLVEYGDQYGNWSRWSEGKKITIGSTTYWWNITGHPSDDYLAHMEGEVSGSDPTITWHWMGPPPAGYGTTIYNWTEQVVENYSSVTPNWVRHVGSKSEPVTYTYKYTVPSGQKGQYEILITRCGPNADSNMMGDRSFLSCVREVFFDPFQYPRQAVVAVRIKASEQISGSFKFSCAGKMSIVQVWNGSEWSIQWSDNPAWVAFDIFTQPLIQGDGTADSPWKAVRFDGIDPSRMDLSKFKEWADFCDDYVPDGKGGVEKRITFNGGFDFDCTMWEAALRVCQVGRSVPIWTGVHLTIAIDKPADPVNLYSVGNINETKFRETFLPIEERATEIEVDYVNSENGYQRDKLTVYHPDLAGNQYRATLDLFGITKPSEVWRAGMYRLNCNKYLIRTAEIDVDLEALNAQIGDVVYIQHDIPKWGEGGRLTGASANAATVDKTVTIAGGSNYKLMLRLAEDVVHEKAVLNRVSGSVLVVKSSNLLLWSEQLNNPYWNINLNEGISADTLEMAAPNGLGAAEKITETAVDGIHCLGRSPVNISIDETYTFSIFLKYAGRKYISLILDDGGANGIHAIFDLQAGAVAKYVSANGNATAVDCGMEWGIGGWLRCWIKGTSSAAGDWARIALAFCQDANSGWYPTYAGDTARAVYAWGAQFELGDISPYTLTTDTAQPGSAFDDSAPFNAGGPYFVGNTVRFGGKIFVCIQNTPPIPPSPPDAAFWSLTGDCPVPEKYDVYAFGEVNSLVKKFRITEMSLKQDDQKATLTLVEYRDEIYEFETIDPGLNDYLHGLPPLAPPTGLKVEEFTEYEYGVSYTRAVFTWQRPKDARIGRYRVWIHNKVIGWKELGVVYGTSHVFKSFDPGLYDFFVRSEAGTGQVSVTAYILKQIYGKLTPPSNVSNFHVNVIGGIASLTWDEVADRDLAFYVIKYSPATSGAIWEQATIVANYVPPRTTMFQTPARVGTYLIKAGDKNGRQSASAAKAVTTISAITGLTPAGSLSNSPAFAGAMTNVTTDESGFLIISVPSHLSDISLVSQLKDFATLDDSLHSIGAYVLSGTLDCGSVATYRIMATIDSTARNYLDKMSQWKSVADRSSFSGGDIENVDVKAFIRRKSLAGDAWSDYTQFTAGDFLGRYFEFKIVLSTTEYNTTPVVKSVTFNAYLPA